MVIPRNTTTTVSKWVSHSFHYMKVPKRIHHRMTATWKEHLSAIQFIVVLQLQCTVDDLFHRLSLTTHRVNMDLIVGEKGVVQCVHKKIVVTLNFGNVYTFFNVSHSISHFNIFISLWEWDLMKDIVTLFPYLMNQSRNTVGMVVTYVQPCPTFPRWKWKKNKFTAQFHQSCETWSSHGWLKTNISIHDTMIVLSKWSTWFTFFPTMLLSRLTFEKFKADSY